MSKVLRAQSIKVGDRLRMKNDSYSGYGLHKGDGVEVTQRTGSYIYINAPTGGRISIPIQSLEKSEETLEEIQQSIKQAEAAIKIEKSKLDWMEKTGNKVYDETEFKVWTTLKTLNSKSTDEQKAKVIADLIKKG